MDIEQNTSITHCLRCFSNTETLCSDNKFKCDNCCSYQVSVTDVILRYQFKNVIFNYRLGSPKKDEGQETADHPSPTSEKV